MKKVKREERGYAGHFIACAYCWFRRNTLLTCGKTRIVVSTVGNYHPSYTGGGAATTIGSQRYYETMAFYAKREAPYWEADTGRGELSFKSNWRIDKMTLDSDFVADAMHEKVVAEFTRRLATGRLFKEPK